MTTILMKITIKIVLTINAFPMKKLYSLLDSDFENNL
jgi:hypothetical protein